jgi:hypothetical protein
MLLRPQPQNGNITVMFPCPRTRHILHPTPGSPWYSQASGPDQPPTGGQHSIQDVRYHHLRGSSSREGSPEWGRVTYAQTGPRGRGAGHG